MKVQILENSRGVLEEVVDHVERVVGCAQGEFTQDGYAQEVAAGDRNCLPPHYLLLTKIELEYVRVQQIKTGTRLVDRLKEVFLFHVYTPGVKIQPDDPTSAVSVFKLLFTDELVKLISDSTNSYADILMENPATQEHMDNHQRSLFNSWKPTNVDEMWIYFAVTLLMGITKKPEYHLYWSKQHLFSTPIFHRLMRRDRFEHIRKMIHFCDPYNEDPSDGLRKLRTTMDYLMYKFMNTYTPERNIAIDEYLSVWKGRLSFRVYIPNKRE